MTPCAPVRHNFGSRAELAEALAGVIGERLEAAIAERGEALFAVSGGSTPALLFETLSAKPLAWHKIVVTLVDERFVPETSPRSNARLVRAKLLRNEAARAPLVGLADGAGDVSVEVAAVNASGKVEALALPFDVLLLGMGADGHTASFFPDAVNLEALLDPKADWLVAPVKARSAEEPRLTLTLPPIADARFVVLHIEGAEKAATLARAMAPGATEPIRRVIDATRTPVEIFWAP